MTVEENMDTNASDDVDNTASDNKKIRKIIETLLNLESQTPKQLAEKFDVHPVTISRYLRILRENDLVEFRRDGVEKHYTVKREKWRKYVAEKILFSGDNFSEGLKESDHHKEDEIKSKRLKITIESEHLDFIEIKKRLGDPVITKVFHILTKPMSINEIHQKVSVPRTTLYTKICALEKLTLVAKKPDLMNLNLGEKYEKSFQELNIIILNEGELIEIIAKSEYHRKMFNRFNQE